MDTLLLFVVCHEVTPLGIFYFGLFFAFLFFAPRPILVIAPGLIPGLVAPLVKHNSPEGEYHLPLAPEIVAVRGDGLIVRYPPKADRPAGEGWFNTVRFDFGKISFEP